MDATVRCMRCRRQLSNPRSVKLRFGPICWRNLTKGNEKMDYGMPRSVSDLVLADQSLRDIHKLVIDSGNREKCWCGKPFYASNIWSFDHEGGREVPGFSRPQWVFVHCSKCNYDTAIWKLGV